MAIEHIRIRFETREGMLRRVLGLIEARGFAIRSMQLTSDERHSVATLGLRAIDDSRRIEKLLRLLSRFDGVEPEAIESPAPAMSEVRHVVAN